MNVAILTGRLVRDPEIRQTPGGKTTASFTVAVDDGKDKDGERKSQFIPVVAWEKTAELVNRHFLKGDPITVTGRITVRQYEKDGQKRHMTEVVASAIEFPPGKPKRETYGTEPATPDAFREIEDTDGELPF